MIVAKETKMLDEYHLNRHRPDKPQFVLHDLNGYLKTNLCQATKPHIHSFYQVLWFKEGVGKHSVDFKEYVVTGNSIFFIAPNQVHHFDEITDYHGILMHFNELFLTQNKSQIEFFLNYNLFNSTYQQPYYCIGTELNHILDIYISQIKRELVNKECFGRELILKNYLQSFLIQVQRARNEFEKSIDPSFLLMGEKGMQLIKFSNLIDENYKKGYSVAEYARLLHISPRTLSDLTQQQLGKTPSQMVKERIILEAQRLLLYSDLNINQVGYLLGFDDPSYFVKYFKKYTNTSPSEFKKSIS